MLILKFILLFNFQSFAAIKPFDLEAQKALALLHSKSITQLKASISDLENRDWNQKLCESQLESKTIPTKCYEHLQWQKKAKKVTSLEFEKLQTLLDGFCVESIADIRSLKDPRLKGAQKQSISSYCRNQILGIKKRLEYQAYDSDRRTLFFGF